MKVTVTASSLCDATGTLIASATAYFTPVKPNGQPLPGFHIADSTSSTQGQASSRTISYPVVNGVLTGDVLSTQSANPMNFAYRLEIKDAGGSMLIGPYLIQPTGPGAFFLDAFVPDIVPLPLIQKGPQGDKGDQGDQGIQGIKGDQGIQGSQGVKGDPGDVSKPQLGRGAGYVVGAQLPKGRNRFDKATYKASTYIGNNGTEATPQTQFYASDFIYVGDLTQFVLNTVLTKEGTGGQCFYDVDKTFLSVLPAQVNAGTPITVPNGAAFFRFYSSAPGFPTANNPAPVDPSAVMLVSGSTVPSTYAAFGYYAKEEVDAKDVSVFNSLQGFFPKYPNLLDLNRVQTASAINYPDHSYNSPGVLASGLTGFNVYGPVPVVPGGTVTCNQPLFCQSFYGPAWVDASGNLLAPSSQLKTLLQGNASIPANTVLNVPANAAGILLTCNVSSGGTGNGGPINISQTMVVQGSTFSGSYQPFVGLRLTNDDTARALAQPLAGVRVGWLGDSISFGLGSNLPLAPLVASLTGHTNTYALSWSGRRMWDALNNTGNTGVAFPTQAIVQGLDVMVLFLGTNLQAATGGNVGTATDTPSAGTTGANGITYPQTDSYAKQLKAVIEQLLTWNPRLRIIKAGPYQSANQNGNAGDVQNGTTPPSTGGLAILKSVRDMDIAVAREQYGVPVLDLFGEMGFNKLNAGSMLPDFVHPDATTQTNRIAPFFARKLVQYALK